VAVVAFVGIKLLATTFELASLVTSVDAELIADTPVPVGSPFITGVANVGEVPNTKAPDPVSSVTAVAKFALVEDANHAPMPEAKPVIDPTDGVTVCEEIAVIKPFAFAVTVSEVVADPKDPTFEFTVARVKALVLFADPSKELPTLVASPVIVPIVRAVCNVVAVPALPVIVV
jgi:hypothetical protein